MIDSTNTLLLTHLIFSNFHKSYSTVLSSAEVKQFLASTISLHIADACLCAEVVQTSSVSGHDDDDDDLDLDRKGQVRRLVG